ncbi:MAG: tRNA adenosine(34) deaminase TadA [Synergistaceae bacterium]|nr:tRNA adenosine(34) deaminase TadA [Synergistaceae bacterium]MBQ3763685.1 tRNA adenosine(34) deaminase TadA [Synergistaceae bacterium]
MTSDDHDHYMKLALLEAQKAFSRGDVPVGALLVKDGVIVSSGSDRKISDPTEHAEIIAIRSFAQNSGCWNLSGCTLYVTLEPCPMCAGACVISRVSTVVYGAKNYRSGAGGTLYNILRDSRLNHTCEIHSGIMENECVKILQDYFIQRRHVQCFRNV